MNNEERIEKKGGRGGGVTKYESFESCVR